MTKTRIRSRLATLGIGILALMLSIVPGIASARQHTGLASPVAAPVFSFPTNGTSYPSNGPYLFQVQPVSGATGYLWSFVQNGMIVYQNLAWDGHLSPASYTIATRSKAHNLIHSGDLHVWVRALMKNSQWSVTGAVMVRIQGKPTTTPGPPAPGTILYRADTSGGFDKWAGSSEWKHLNGMLLNDGSASVSAIRSPYQPGPIVNYAVEAQIQVVANNDPNCADGFGIFVRGQGNTAFYALTNPPCSVEGLSQGSLDAAGADTNSGATTAHFSPGTDWHTYRVEVKGNMIRVLVDGSILITQTDNRLIAPDGGMVGLLSHTTFGASIQYNVRSFKVIAL